MKWPGSPWKQRLTDVSGARGVAAPVPRTGQCRHDMGKTARDGTQGPMKKRADLLLVRNSQGREGPHDPGRKERTYCWQKSIANSRQELAKSGCGRKTASRRMARVAHTCNDVYQVGKQSQVPHSRSASMSQQHHLRCTGRRIDNELGKRDHVTGTALEQGCSRKQTKTQSSTRQSWCNDRWRTAQTLLRVQRLSSRSPSTRSSTSLSRCREAETQCVKNALSKIPQSKDPDDRGDSVQKIVEISSGRSWSADAIGPVH